MLQTVLLCAVELRIKASLMGATKKPLDTYWGLKACVTCKTATFMRKVQLQSSCGVHQSVKHLYFFCNGVFVRFRPLIAPRDWICWSELVQFSFFDCLNRWRWFLSKTDAYTSLFLEFLLVVHFLMCVRRSWSLSEFYWRHWDSWVQYFYASSHFLNWAEAEAGVKTNPDSNIKTTFIFEKFVQ